MLDRVSVHGSPVSSSSPDSDWRKEILTWLTDVRDDPYAFAMGAFPWGEAGTQLEAYTGPMPWAIALMERIRLGLISPDAAIQEAFASGHGIGKSTTVSMLILWAFMTFPDCRGVVTANTEVQLKTKTWAELGKWFNMCWFAREFFTLNATSLISKDPIYERTWRIDMIPWSKTNPQAFAGLHNKGNRMILVFDEASEIEDIIWETAEGAFTDKDTQLIWLVFGNPTKNSGRFRECFDGGQHAGFWHSTQIDSRTVPIYNKDRADRLIKVYGVDSDYVRIRILGQFPRMGLMEFFSATEIEAAMSPDREVFVDALAPLALGVDVARYGKNNSVLFPRKGRDARTIERKVFNGVNTVELSNWVFDCWTQWHPDGIFIDGGGVGGGVVDQCRAKHLFVTEVQFGAKDSISGTSFATTGEKYANMRSAMHGALRAWLPTGALPKDDDLRAAMLAIRYTFNNRDEIVLVSKEDLMEDNPGLKLDDLDALALTFGGPIASSRSAGGEGPRAPIHVSEYNPFSSEFLEGTQPSHGDALAWDPFKGQLQ
jgi:hypothetical protein